MLTLHTGLFARLLTTMAIVGLLLGGATTSVMAMPMTQVDGHSDMASMMSADVAHQAGGMSHHDAACEQAGHAYGGCADNDAAFQCDTAGDCCPHGATALPPQVDTAFSSLPTVQAAAPQWRSTSVTSVTEIRPPISTL